MIEVGKTYTSKNGYEWLCITVDGEYAYMRASFTPFGTAYCFKTDGTNISQGGGDWDISFPPVEQWITTRFSVGVSNRSAPDGVDNHVAYIRFKLVDGEPDWSSAKLTGV